MREGYWGDRMVHAPVIINALLSNGLRRKIAGYIDREIGRGRAEDNNLLTISTHSIMM